MRQPQLDIRNAIRQLAPGIEVGFVIPGQLPDKFILLDVTPPRSLSPVSAELLLFVQVYAPDDDAALRVLDELTEKLDVLNDQPWCLGWEVGHLPHRHPDPDRRTTARWQANFTLIYSLD